MCFFKKFNRDVFVCLLCRNYNSVPGSQACFTQFRVIERFCAGSKKKGSHRGALAVRIYKFFIDCTFRVGIPNLLFPMNPLSIPTPEHVPLQHFDG